ncbi:MAG TPA: protoporphyrinogen oxidase [Candidatus Acidoferrum sp.]|nr:protoporphyrinogen oxidase [Candidatus Acidoferrum sp.]
MGYTEKVAVVGAGISGLACAYRLKQLGVPCLVLEARERAGGLIASIRRNGLLFETGPQCPRFPASVWQLVRELNLETEFVPGDAKAKRYILRDGELRRAPFSPGGLIGTQLLGVQSKLRILTEVFRSSQPPPREESLAEFVQRKFGKEVLDYLVDPLISTIFFGDAHQMGMESAFPALVEWEKKHGSLVRGAIHARNSKKRELKTDSSGRASSTNGKRGSLRVTDALPSLGSFRSGMAALPERLAANLQEEIRYNAGIEHFEQVRNPDGVMNASWEIVLSSGEKIRTGHLILAVPAYVAAGFLANTVPQLANSLEAIEYAPVCAVSSAYLRAQVANPLDGFGYMIPRREGLQTICTFWNSSLFPGRAPEGQVLITSFAGRELNGIDATLDEENLARIVEAENARALGISGLPIDRVVWEDTRALPQYNVGHTRRVSEIQNILSAVPNLKIVGNFLKGRSIGDCVDLAFSAAQDVHSRIREENIQVVAESSKERSA